MLHSNSCVRTNKQLKCQEECWQTPFSSTLKKSEGSLAKMKTQILDILLGLNLLRYKNRGLDSPVTLKLYSCSDSTYQVLNLHKHFLVLKLAINLH